MSSDLLVSIGAAAMWFGLGMSLVSAIFAAVSLYRAERSQRRQAFTIVDDANGAQQVGTHRSREPFEIETISNYYRHALARSNISFWFSMLFASVGFLVIVVAGFGFAGGDATASVLKLAGGTIVEMVAGLFFVQSNGSQKSMESFFEKLRFDRQALQARELVDSIEDPVRRDALREEMVRLYAGVAAPRIEGDRLR